MNKPRQSTAPLRSARLSDRLISSLPVGLRDYLVTDTETKKLKLKVTPSGNKSFVVRYRSKDGVERKHKLGDYPDINATTARRLASEALARVALGEDPSMEAQERRRGVTVADIAQTFLTDFAPLHLRKSTIAGYEQILRRNILPRFGSRRLISIEKSDVATFQSEMAPTKYQSNRAIGLLRRLYAYAEEVGVVPEGTNPAAKVKLRREEPRERLLHAHEIATIGRIIHNLRTTSPQSTTSCDVLLFLLFTGCRRGEALGLMWEDVDFERRQVKFRKTKTVPRQQYISDPLLSLLRQRKFGSSSLNVFPGRDPSRPITDIKKTWDRIRTEAGLPEVRLHDLRHTVLSDIAAESDIQTARSVGGHASLASTMRYIHSRSNETERAIQATTGRVSQLLNSTSRTDPPQGE